MESLDLSQWACSHDSAKNLAGLSLPLFINRSRELTNKVNIYFRLWIFVGNQWVVRTHNTRSYFLNETYSLVNSPLHQQRATLLAFFLISINPRCSFLLSESKKVIVIHTCNRMSSFAVYRRVTQTWNDVPDLPFIFSKQLWPDCLRYCNGTNCIQKFHISTFFTDFFKMFLF